jgi:hypothetical protein
VRLFTRPWSEICKLDASGIVSGDLIYQELNGRGGLASRAQAVFDTLVRDANFCVQTQELAAVY